MTPSIIRLIQQYESDGDFSHASISDKNIEDAERILSVKLPVQYKEFLLQYGHGGLDGFEVLGIGKTGNLLFVDETKTYRLYGLPNNLVVVENCDEWLYCIDCNNEHILCWENGSVHHAFDSFDDYFLDRLNDAIENM